LFVSKFNNFLSITIDYQGLFSIKGALEITWKKANVTYLKGKLVLESVLAGLRNVKMILSTADF